MKRVAVISPLEWGTPRRVRNLDYLCACLRDSLLRGEAPFASHRMYTDALDDASVEERQIGMDAGHAWIQVAELAVVYIDRGYSPGMSVDVERAKVIGLPVEERRLGGEWKVLR